MLSSPIEARERPEAPNPDSTDLGKLCILANSDSHGYSHSWLTYLLDLWLRRHLELYWKRLAIFERCAKIEGDFRSAWRRCDSVLDHPTRTTAHHEDALAKLVEGGWDLPLKKVRKCGTERSDIHIHESGTASTGPKEEVVDVRVAPRVANDQDALRLSK